MDLSCLLGISHVGEKNCLFCHRLNALLTQTEVKWTAEYCPKFFFCILMSLTLTLCWSIKRKEKKFTWAI